MTTAKIKEVQDKIAALDPVEITRAMIRAQLRLQAEEILPVLCAQFDLAPADARLLLQEALMHGDNLEEVVVVLHSLSATWVGESDAWAHVVEPLRGQKVDVPAFADVMRKISAGLGEVVGHSVLPSVAG